MSRFIILITFILTVSINIVNAGEYNFEYFGNTSTSYSPIGGAKRITYDKTQNPPVIKSVSILSEFGFPSSTTLFEYDQNNFPSTVTYPNGSKYITHYDDTGLLTSKTENAGTSLTLTTSYTWNDHRMPLTVSYSNGLTKSFVYDEHQQPLSVTSSDGKSSRIWQYTYDKYGQPLTAKAPYNNDNYLIKYSYDNQEKVKTISNQLGQKITFNQYDANGYLLSKTDANGIETKYTYDSMSLPLSIMINGDITTHFTYDGNNHIKTITSPSGIITTYDYNYWKDLKQITDNIGNQIIQNIDPMGNVIKRVIQDKSGNVLYEISFAYNSLNQLDSIIDASGNITKFEYDKSGNVIKTTNAKGSETHDQYNIQNNINQSKNALNETSQLTYDAFGNVTSISDFNGNVTKYTYNTFNQLTEIDNPDKGVTKYHYNNAGQLESQTDANGITMSYLYDQLSRLTGINLNGNILKQYIYDQGKYGVGRLSSVKNTISEINYSYNALGNITIESEIIDSANYNVDYGYNKDQAISSITYPSGLKVNFTHDQVGNINGITADNHGIQAIVASDIQYLPFGSMKSLIFGNGTKLNRNFDKAYQLKSQIISGVSDDSYIYDQVGNITQFVSKDDPTKSKTYEYDAIDRLTSMKSQLETQSFTYDANGNRLTYAGSKDGQSTYQYDQKNNKLQSYQDKENHAVNYDNNGNITKLGNLTFTYDVFNNLTLVKKDSTELASYAYNPLNQRIVKTVNGNKTVFIYDQFGKLIEIRKPDSIIDIIYLNGEPIAQLVNGKTYYFVNDALGTPEYLTGQNGDKQWSGNINPFSIDAKGKVTQSLRFSGQVNDSESGLVYNNAREYIPFLGRYLQADPLGLGSGSLNNYVYAVNNPVNLIDPSGRCIEDACIVEGIVVVEGVELAAEGVAAAESWLEAELVGDEAEAIQTEAQASRTKICSKPYANSRPSYGKGQVDDVWNSALDENGEVFDPNTGEQLFWDKGKPRNGQWDMGHKPNQEYWKLKEAYMRGDISKEDFLKEYRNPDNYTPESPSSNRSHKFETK